MIRVLGVMIALLLMAGPGAAREGLSVYVFGNSLIHHLSDSDETTAPHWMALLAKAKGDDLRLDGQWGFMRDFLRDGPQPKWAFKTVAAAWTDRRQPFAEVGFDVVMTNPANFLHYRTPNQPYEGDNPDGHSPVTATAALIDMTAPKRFVIYEGWSDMAPFTGSFPPWGWQYQRYLRFNAGDYHQWFVDYAQQVQAARPDVQVELLPVASVLSALLDDGPLADLAPEDLYSDLSPHGTPTLYFLAGAISYAGLTRQALPAEVDLPETVHPLVKTQYSAVVETIHTALGLTGGGGDGGGTGLEAPSLAMGLDGTVDWSRQQPFLDKMKTARPWTGHKPGQWGGMSFEEMIAGGFVDEQGWIKAIPPGLRAVETLFLTDQAAEASSLKGRYRVTWAGQGEIKITGRGRMVKRGAQEAWFTYVPGDGPAGIEIIRTDPADPIRDIVVLHETHIPLYQAGALFNPDWMARIADLRVLRMMDWMHTNNSKLTTWETRPKVGDFTYAWRGVPVEVMVTLANEVAADLWVTLPHQADDDHVRRFAEVVHDGLDADRKAYVEYSNEMWNFSFFQTHWAREQAIARWGEGAPGDAWIQFAGMRAAQVADIWAKVFAADPARLVRVVAVHTGWKGLEQAQLEAPLAQAEGLPAPAKSFDAYAVTGYFGVELGGDDGAPQVRDWIKAAQDQARADGVARGYKRVKLDQHVKTTYAAAAIDQAVAVLRAGSLKTLIEDLWPYHLGVAASHGLRLVMYEGGTHVVGLGVQVNDEALTEFFVALNYSEGMAGLYEDLLQGWKAAGGTLFNAFVDVGRPGKWGSWGAQRYLEDENPRYAVLREFNATTPAWWAEAPGNYRHGALIRGSDAADQMAGSGRRDIFLAGAGDDVIRLAGPGDRVHGGDGTDRVILPGARADYRFLREGGRIVAQAEGQRHSLFSVEEVTFEGADGPGMALETLTE